MAEILHLQSGENYIIFLGCDVIHSFRYIPTFSRDVLPLISNLTIKMGSASKLLTYIYTRYHILDLQLEKKQMIYYYYNYIQINYI